MYTLEVLPSQHALSCIYNFVSFIHRRWCLSKWL